MLMSRLNPYTLHLPDIKWPAAPACCGLQGAPAPVAASITAQKLWVQGVRAAVFPFQVTIILRTPWHASMETQFGSVYAFSGVLGSKSVVDGSAEVLSVL